MKANVSPTFQLEVRSIQRILIAADVTSVFLELYTGPAMISKGHTPFFCKIPKGNIKYTQGTQENILYTDGGFAQIENQKILILLD